LSPVAAALHRCVNALEKPAHLFDWPDRDQFDTAFVDKRLQLLPDGEFEAFADRFGNLDSKIR